MPDSWFNLFYSVLSLYSLRSLGCQNSRFLEPFSLKFEVIRFIKSCNGEIHAYALKSSHLLSPASAASISAFEVKLVLRPWRPILGHFDNRTVWKLNRIIWEDFEMWPRATSKQPRRSNLKNQCIYDLKRKLRPWNVIEYVIKL